MAETQETLENVERSTNGLVSVATSIFMNELNAKDVWLEFVDNI